MEKSQVFSIIKLYGIVKVYFDTIGSINYRLRMVTDMLAGNSLMILIGCLILFPYRSFDNFNLDRRGTPVCFLLLMENTAALFHYVLICLLIEGTVLNSISNHSIQSLDILFIFGLLIIILYQVIKEPEALLWTSADCQLLTAVNKEEDCNGNCSYCKAY